MMLNKAQIDSIKALVKKALSYSRILKAQRGRVWDEGKVVRSKEKGHEGEFSRGGGRSQMDLGPPERGGPFTRAQRGYEADKTYGAKQRQREGMTAIQPGMERTYSNIPYSKRRGAGFTQDVLNYQQRQEKAQQRGKGFANRPRGGEGVPEPPPESVSADARILDALKTGEATDSEGMGTNSANALVKVTLDTGVDAVYKPERGEAWHGSFTNHDISRFITNKDFSLAEREAFASEVDQALQASIVPLTVHRTRVDETNININTEGDDGGGGGYDSYEAREEYDRYKEQMIDDDSIMEEVGQRFEKKFDEAKDEHVSDIESRREEMQEIWDELIKDYPEGMTPHGAQSELRKHPVLPMGSVQGFERREKKILDEVNPIDLLDEVNADVTAKLSDKEKERLRESMKEYLDQGYRTLGEVDEDQAKEHLDRDDWYQEHENTEAEIRDEVYGEKVQSFTAWRQSKGYMSGGGGGSGEDRNPDAPHPGGGSFQHFREADHYGDVTDEQGAKLAVVDYVIGTMDRHGNNLMFDDDGLVAIDNGYSMPDLPASRQPDKFQFRSEGVDTWLGNGGTIPSETREQMLKQLEATDWQALVDRHPSMTANERAAFLGRVGRMKQALQTTNGLRNLWQNLDRF